MRKRLGQAVRIGVSERALTLLKTSRWAGAPLTLLAEQEIAGAALEDTAQALRRLLGGAGCANWPVSLVLADELVRMWHVTPPRASARMADLQAAAALRFESLYGEPADNWKLAAHWDAGQPFLAVAVMRPLLAVLEQGVREHKLDIVEIVPQFVAGWNRWRNALKPGAWFALLHENVLTVGAIEAGALASVRAVALPAQAGSGWLDAHLAREALLLNLTPPERLQLCAMAPPPWCCQPEQAQIPCSLLEPACAPLWPAGMRLAATGSRA